MYKLRNIAFQRSGDPVKGLTCPEEIALFSSGVYFNVVRLGTSIIYTSGANQIMTKKQVEIYKYEDCRVE